MQISWLVFKAERCEPHCRPRCGHHQTPPPYLNPKYHPLVKACACFDSMNTQKRIDQVTSLLGHGWPITTLTQRPSPRELPQAASLSTHCSSETLAWFISSQLVTMRIRLFKKEDRNLKHHELIANEARRAELWWSRVERNVV